jgi:hypothetical protein
MTTIYQQAQSLMDLEIARYLTLIENTHGLSQINSEHLVDYETAILFAAGISSQVPPRESQYADFLISEYNRKSAITFDIENAVCFGVYLKLRAFIEDLFNEALEITNGFSEFSSKAIKENPHLLPVFQNSLNLSKAQLKRQIGSISDTSISKPASEKLSELLSNNCTTLNVQRVNILQRMEITLEGIVRDLVGRVLFEEVVAHALDQYQVQYLREGDYTAISGVVYNFRSDFVLPNPDNPIAFIEVRKSSSRHASLYAKDKMFSAINWKGRYKDLIGVIVVEGEWTQATLRTMASVFDYVIPLAKVTELAKLLKRAQDGDKSVLKWIIEFSIYPSPNFSE